MAIPKYYELYRPLLESIQEGGVYSMAEIRDRVAQQLGLTAEDLSERLPSQRQSVFDNRMGWAKAYLKKAGLLTDPKRAACQITEEGRKLLELDVRITDRLLADRYPDFAEFRGGKRTEMAEAPARENGGTPQETFEEMFRAINAQLADDLLTEIMQQPPAFFEELVVDLMRAMDYGDGFVTKTSGDGGVDGIIHEDKLGFDLIYIQAKRWDPEKTIGRPEIQKFCGAMLGPPRVEKGLFITTARFSQGARDYAEAQRIILVDGQRLTELMIEHGVGVSVQKTYAVKRIDSDYFPSMIPMLDTPAKA